MILYKTLLDAQPKSKKYKLCYLKETKKPVQSAPRDNLSLTLLSSYLQNQHYTHSYSHSQIQPISYDHHQTIGMLTHPQLPPQHTIQSIHPTKTRAPGSGIYTERRTQKRRRGNSDQTRLLNVLVGDAVEDPVSQIRPTTRNLLDKKVRRKEKRLPSYEDEERAISNKQMFRTHFECFLDKSKQSQIKTTRTSTNTLINKMDEKYSCKNIPFLYDLKFTQQAEQHRDMMRTNHSKSQVKKQKKQRNLETSRLGPKISFKEVQYFELSKVSKNKRFRFSKP